MVPAVISRFFWMAANDPDFRGRALSDLGFALAQDGFVLSDEEMHELLALWEPLVQMPERRAIERIRGLAHRYTG